MAEQTTVEKRTISLRRRNAKPMTIEAEIYGQVGVHPTLIRQGRGLGFSDTDYSVTHLESGRAIREHMKPTAARTLAKALAAIDLDHMHSEFERLGVVDSEKVAQLYSIVNSVD